MRKRPLADQVVVVIGGSSGVGRAVARAAADRGARVVVAARGEEGLQAAVREVEGRGSEGLAVPVDVARERDLRHLAHEAQRRFGRVDSVVACAFVSVYGEFEQLQLREIERVLDVNLFGRIRALRAFLPALRESRGTFVDVNSALAYRGIPLQSAYCASKAATRTFLESVRVELQREGTGVDISVLLPGAINTPHFDRVRQKLGVQPQPVPPIYQPEVVADAVLRACERPVRELPVGFGGQKALWGAKLAPHLTDAWLRRRGWSDQTTGEPKDTSAPDNLQSVMPGDPGAHGRFEEGVKTSSAWTAVRLRRGGVGAAAALGAGLALATMSLRKR